jgi:hypothetical protein
LHEKPEFLGEGWTDSKSAFALENRAEDAANPKRTGETVFL